MTTQHDREMAELRAELASLREAVAALTARTAKAEAATVPAVPSISGEAPADRRTFLRGGAIAAGAIAASAAASVAGAAPAAAANGDALVLGYSSEATQPTGLLVDLSEHQGFPLGIYVADTDPVGDQFTFAAILGYAAGPRLRVGVEGRTDGEETAGVYGVGLAHQSVGVFGNGNEAGVFAVGQKTAITAESDTGIGLDVGGGTAALRLRSRLITQDFENESHEAGEVISAQTGPNGAALLFCIESGTPGRWRLVTGGSSAGTLNVLGATVRLYDSRPGNPPDTGPKTKLTGAGSPRTITVPPTGVTSAFRASAALVNLTVVNTSAGGGFVALHQGGTPWPGNSNINWTAAGTVLANAATVALDDQGRFELTCAAGASTDIIIDLIGYYA